MFPEGTKLATNHPVVEAIDNGAALLRRGFPGPSAAFKGTPLDFLCLRFSMFPLKGLRLPWLARPAPGSPLASNRTGILQFFQNSPRRNSCSTGCGLLRFDQPWDFAFQFSGSAPLWADRALDVVPISRAMDSSMRARSIETGDLPAVVGPPEFR